MNYIPDREINPPEDKHNDFETCVICLKDISPYNTSVVKDEAKMIIVCNKCKNTHKL